MIRLDRNERTLPPPPQVLAAVRAAAAGANRYPRDGGSALEAELARSLGCAGGVLVGAGSGSLLDLPWRLAVGPGRAAAYAGPAFEMYGFNTAKFFGTTVEVPLTGALRSDLDALAAAARRGGVTLVALNNPHNPTGTWFPAERLRRFLVEVPPEVLVVVDEAYHEFSAEGDGLATARLAFETPNVVLARSFSKAWGLAGLRIGYLVGSPDLIGRLRRWATPFSVSELACAAARAAMRLPEPRRWIAEVTTRRELLVKTLRARGLTVPDRGANFVYAAGADGLAEHLAAAGIRVLSTTSGVRITVGDEDECARVVAACARWDAVGGRP